MDNQLIESLINNADMVDKALIGYVIWTIKNFSIKFDTLVQSVNELNSNLAVSYEKHDNQDDRLRQLEKQMTVQREKYHELVNDHIGQIELNKEKIKTLESRV